MTVNKDLDKAFEKLVGRQANDQERIRLYKVKDALNINPDDSLWLIIIVLEHYVTLYETIPKRIADLYHQQPQQTRETRWPMICATLLCGAVIQLIWQILSHQVATPLDTVIVILLALINLLVWSVSHAKQR